MKHTDICEDEITTVNNNDTIGIICYIVGMNCDGPEILAQVSANDIYTFYEIH